MPHFVIDCSENIIKLKSPEKIIQEVYNAAESTNLFEKGDIKVRISPFEFYKIGNAKNDFIHVFGHIMEGRSVVQKKNLSDEIVSKLKSLLPNVSIISMNVSDFEKATYSNKSMV